MSNRRSIPLTHNQERLWLLSRIDRYHYHHNRPWAVRIHGSLDRQKLGEAVQQLFNDIHIFRAGVKEEQGTPRLEILDSLQLHLPFLDFSRENKDHREAAARNWILEDLRKPFNLENPPLLRPALIRLSDDDYLLNLCSHPIIMDGWSEAIFVRELSQRYTQKEHHSELSPSPQFTAVAHKEMGTDTSILKDPRVREWISTIMPDLPPLTLPFNHPPALDSVPAYASFLSRLDKPLTEAIRALARSQEKTPAAIYTTAFLLLLNRITGEDISPIGLVISTRDRTDLQNMIGPLTNILPLQINLPPDLPFQEAVQTVWRKLLLTAEQRHLPLELLIKELQPPRNLTHSPFFDVVINHRTYPTIPKRMGDLEISNFELPPHSGGFFLTFDLLSSGNEKNLSYTYRSDLFSQDTIQHLSTQFQSILEQAVTNNEKRLKAFTLCTSLSSSLLPDPTTPLVKPDTTPVPEQIRQLAEKYPEYHAVADSRHNWTYSQLQHAADCIGGFLLQKGLQKGDIVALHGHCSFGLIAAMIGTWQAGGVFLNLDPDYPPIQLKHMLREGSPRFLIEDERVQTLTKTDLQDKPTHFLLDALTGRILSKAFRGDSPIRPLRNRSADTACIFFTSGTTGKSKGVRLNHGGIANLIKWAREYLKASPEDRYALLTGVSFDALIFDLFISLTGGGTFIIRDPDLSPGSPSVLQWLQHQNITLFLAVPSLIRSWLSLPSPGVDLSNIRHTICAGEPLSEELCEQWRIRFPEAGPIQNLYGPTEAVIINSFYPVPTPPDAGIQPIGYPVSFNQLLVLSPENRQCGINEPGEITIRSPWLTHAYMDPDSANASRFQQNPFRDDPDDLIYRSGDIGRILPNGAIQWMGRNDDQVKIHGLRIEPEGIRHTILSHPDVQETLILPYTNQNRETALAAYVVAHGLSSQELCNYLAGQVHPGMIPQAIHLLDSLPITPRGKVDRSKLPDPLIPSTTKRAPLPPQNSIETALAPIWEDVLECTPINRTTSFFEAGGNSILASILLVKIEQEFGIRLPFRSIYNAPTIEGMASSLEKEGYGANWKSLIPLHSTGSKPPLFCFHWAGGHVFSYVELAAMLGDDQPVYGLQDPTIDHMQSPFKTLKEMAAFYLEEIQSIQPEGPYFLMGASMGGRTAFEAACQLQDAGKDVGLVIMLDTPLVPRQKPGFVDRARAFAHRTHNLSLYKKFENFLDRSNAKVRRLIIFLCVKIGIRVPTGIQSLSEIHRQLAFNHNPEPLDAPVMLILAGKEAAPDGMQTTSAEWGSFVVSPISVASIETTHQGLLAQPYLSETARAVRNALRKTRMY